MEHFEFYDSFTVGVTGEGTLRDYFHTYYEDFHVVDSSDSADLICDFTDTRHHPERILGGGPKSFGKKAESFLMNYKGAQMRIVSDWSRIEVNNDFSKVTFRTVFEAELRMKLAEKRGMAMIHASGVDYDGTTIIFPAWRHTGKTNTMLTFVMDGASYLGDDRVFIDEHGTAWGFSIPVNLLYYNLQAFPSLADVGIVSKGRNAVSDKVASLTAQRGSKIAIGLSLFNRNFIRDGKKIDISDLDINPRPTFLEQAELDSITMLQRSGQSKPDIEVNELSADTFQKSVTSITYTEWDQMLYEIYWSFDQLFPEQPNRVDVLKDLNEREQQIIQDVCRETATLQEAVIPDGYDWKEGNTALVEKVIQKTPPNQ